MAIGLCGLPRFIRVLIINMPESSTEKQSPQCSEEIKIDKTKNLAKPLNEPGGWPEFPEGNSCNPHGYSDAQSLPPVPESDKAATEYVKQRSKSQTPSLTKSAIGAMLSPIVRFTPACIALGIWGST